MIKKEELEEFEKLNPIELSKSIQNEIINEGQKHLAFIELDEIKQLFSFQQINTLRTLLDNMEIKSKQRVLDGINNSQYDEVYEKRYKSIKRINDLFTYYVERN